MYTLLVHIRWSCHSTAFQTLADPTRFRIVEVLLGGEHAVNDIVRKVDIDQSGVSRHLRILQEAGVHPHVRPDGPKRPLLASPRALPRTRA